MTEISESSERRARWVGLWREAVTASDLAMGLTDVSTARFVELSPRAADLLGTTPDEGSGLNYLDVAERPLEAAETFRLAREGVLDGIRARRRYQRTDGTRAEIESSGWVIRSPAGPALLLWVAHEVPSESDHTTVAGEVVTASPSTAAAAGPDGARFTLDDHWRISAVGTNAGLVLGRPPAELLAASIIELTHIADRGALLLAFARATTASNVSVRVRLRHGDNAWRSSDAALTVLDSDGTSPFDLVVPVDDADVSASRGVARSRLEAELLRIADELRIGRMVSRTGQLPDPVRFPALSRLTRRESEVLARLMDGDRVPSIAADLFVSQSTVRHHLSSIFSKLGVHSQAELIRYLRSE